MPPRTKSQFGVILTKETQVQQHKPRCVRLVFDNDALNWQTGEFSLDECNGIIISRQTGFFCTAIGPQMRPFSLHSDSRSVHGLKNILSLYQCNKTQKLSMLHNVFRALIEMVPSPRESMVSLNRSMKDLCSEIKLVLKVEFKPKVHGAAPLDALGNASDHGDVSKDFSKDSSIDVDRDGMIHAVQLDQNNAMFKDLPSDRSSRRGECIANSRYLALKKRYETLKASATRQSAVYLQTMEQKDQMIEQLKQEIVSQEQSIEILRLALDSQTDITNRRMAAIPNKLNLVNQGSSSIPRPQHSFPRRVCYTSNSKNEIQRDKLRELKDALKGMRRDSKAKQPISIRTRGTVLMKLKGFCESQWTVWDMETMDKMKGIDRKMDAMNGQISGMSNKVGLVGGRCAEHTQKVKQMTNTVDIIWKLYAERSSLLQQSKTELGGPMRLNELFGHIGHYFSSNVRNVGHTLGF